ncbi:MAG: Biopolymer transport protein ExbD/TolR [Rhodanobacteraceae bacterium]|jgi:biopolymer transport protein ExbD|nr:MAG: Biopolymer transport protein ExbD/TolR [Rhodanobacteraceae bacterium]
MRIGNDNADEFEINVVSLIDVLLTLLMFFVLTTTFVQQGHLKVSLPQASDKPATPVANTLVIVIDKQGHFFVADNRVLGDDESTLSRAIQAVAGGDHERAVLLRADAMTPHQAVVTAMDALGRLGFTHLSIATTPASGAPAS